MVFGRFCRYRSVMFSSAVCCLVMVAIQAPARGLAASPSEALSAFYRGAYDDCIELTQAEVERGVWNVFWSRQLMESLLAVGRYSDACEVYESVVEKFPTNLRLRMLAADAYRYSGQGERGQELLDEIPYLVQQSNWRFRDVDNLLAIGQYSLDQGEDARDVLAFYEAILKQDSKNVDAHIAIGVLALEKSDFQEAAKSLATAVELRPDDPEIHYLLSKAWAPSDGERATEHLQAALGINSQHPPSLLIQVENLVTAEQYEAAESVLESVLSINPKHPEAWAYRSAIAHLRGEYAQEAEYRKRALESWEINPAVDHWIGKILSQHYRFEESVTYQRRSLRLSPAFRPAKFQLAQDLLRLGRTDEGWTLVEQVAEDDKYNVVAFNLRTLQDRLDSFATLRDGGIIVRMDSREAEIYGERVLALLRQAREVLSDKYELDLREPITIEIFPDQSDFAIRTFGLPGGAGFLGVCFGSLITANSPASQGDSPSNWESVLWHEFCHVVTLQKTNNRMPRWLSEGISVYEELQRDPGWGQRMNPLYRKMLLGDDFVPLSQLSGAFLNPKSPLHLQFAYFESSMAIGYLIEKHGLPRMRRLLVDLGVGVPAADAISRLYGDPDVLDTDFKQYAQALAEEFAAGVDFSTDSLPEGGDIEILELWLEDNPASYAGRRQLIEQLLTADEVVAALEQAKLLVETFHDDFEPGGAQDLLVACARRAGDVELEAETLEKILAATSDNVPALQRLLEVRREQNDWASVLKLARELLAVQPLIPTGHEALRDAARELGEVAEVVGPLRALQQLSPTDPALLHYQLASAFYELEKPEEARIEVLQALEYSPRYRAAQKLLVAVRQTLDAPAGLAMRKAQVGLPPIPTSPKSDSEGR